MPQYLFCFDQKSSTFPERYRVVRADQDAEFLRATEGLTGTVVNSEAIAFLDDMIARHQSDDSKIVEFVDAPHWRFIELRFNPGAAEGDDDANEGSPAEPGS